MMKRIVLCILLLLAASLAGCQSGLESGGSIRYAGPSEVTVRMDETLQGTDIQYAGYEADGAVLLIADQQAIKKVGDSVEWQGTPVSGAEVDLSYRIVSANEERLIMVGVISVVVEDPAPAAATFPDQPEYKYKVAVTYNVETGDTIPGTTISYLGKTSDGAQFSGVSGYPYRKLGDSLAYAGRLRDNVYLDTTMRLVAYTDGFVQVAGLAELALTE